MGSAVLHSLSFTTWASEDRQVVDSRHSLSCSLDENQNAYTNALIYASGPSLNRHCQRNQIRLLAVSEQLRPPATNSAARPVNVIGSIRYSCAVFLSYAVSFTGPSDWQCLLVCKKKDPVFAHALVVLLHSSSFSADVLKLKIPKQTSLKPRS